MKVLLLGSGGREHALFWKLSQSPGLTKLRAFPGNGGFPPEAIVPGEAGLDLSNLSTVVDYVRAEKYDLVVVGPEQPLVDGIADALAGVCPVFGPGKAAARLEGSKDFSKDFMDRHGIPTAQSRTFTELQPALDYLRNMTAPIVIKADGLAAGKGVAVCLDLASAEEALRDRLERDVFGNAGHTVLIEEFMQGEETSVFAICDGERAVPFLASQDHKRAYDGDQGPNTGGMGAYLPVPFVDDALMRQVQTQVLDRAVAGMKADGSPYRGLLYAGLMVKDGNARVVEFNVRFGDPETQALMRILDEDLLELMYQAAAGSLPDRPLRIRPGAALVVVVAAEGYPGAYKKDLPLKNIDSDEGDIIFFHAGTRRAGDRLLSTGGRVLGVTAVGADLVAARKAVYDRLKNIDADGVFYRKDIGEKAL
ncbi:MAG: phosphoribosylamine--glycine ligase [Leptospirales bacterium]